MSVIRNFIEVMGIAREEDLPQKSFGQIIKYSEAEHIIIPREKSGIKDIYQIGVKVEIKSKRAINTADSRTIILDGIKNYKIICTQHENPESVVMINVQQPYNTFFELPKSIKDIDNIYIHILDAYFEVLEKRRIYGHFIYLIDVRYTTIDRTFLEESITPEHSKSKLTESQIAMSGVDLDLMNEEANASNELAIKKNYKMLLIRDIDCEYL